MSAIQETIYKCDHCGFTCNDQEGDGDLGWEHAHYGGLGAFVGFEVDLCPNCVSELKAWLRAGPQHEEYRRQLQAHESVADTRRREKMALTRHPAGNSRFIVDDQDPSITLVPTDGGDHAF